MSEQSHLWAIAYDDVGRADEVRDEIKRLGWDTHYLILDDVAVVVRHPDGSFTFNHEPFPALSNVLACTAVGLPRRLGGSGAAGRRRRGRGRERHWLVAASSVGIKDDFVREVEALMKPGTSALFVLDDEGDMDVILHQIRGLGGTVVKTNVDAERAKLIQSTLAAVGRSDRTGQVVSRTCLRRKSVTIFGRADCGRRAARVAPRVHIGLSVCSTISSRRRGCRAQGLALALLIAAAGSARAAASDPESDPPAATQASVTAAAIPAAKIAEGIERCRERLRDIEDLLANDPRAEAVQDGLPDAQQKLATLSRALVERDQLAESLRFSARRRRSVELLEGAAPNVAAHTGRFGGGARHGADQAR